MCVQCVKMIFGKIDYVLLQTIKQEEKIKQNQLLITTPF